MIDYGSLRIKLGVDPQPVHTDSAAASAATDNAASAALRKLGGELKTKLAEASSLCEFAADARTAQWLVQIRDGKLVLIAKDAAQIRGKLPPEVAQFSVRESDSAAEIVGDMTKIARVQNLLNLTKADESSGGGTASDDPSQVNVKLELLRFDGKSDHKGKTVDLAKEPLVLLPGNYVGWRMTNLGQTDVAVCLLYIDAGFGITAIYPRRLRHGRHPHQERRPPDDEAGQNNGQSVRQ